MKNILLSAFLFLLIFQTKAQQIAVASEHVAKVPVAALNWENQKLRSDLTLNEAQFSEVKEITLERYKARQIVGEMFKFEPKKREARIKEIDKQFDKEFGEILNEKQFKKYLKLQGRNAETDQTETVGVQEPEGPNFNAQIQALILKATTPVIDPALLPKQDTISQQVAYETENDQEIYPAGVKTDTLETTDFNKEEPGNSIAIESEIKENLNIKNPETGLKIEKMEGKNRSDSSEDLNKIETSE